MGFGLCWLEEWYGWMLCEVSQTSPQFSFHTRAKKLLLTVSENLSLGMRPEPLFPTARLECRLPIFQHNINFTMCVLTYILHSSFVLAIEALSSLLLYSPPTWLSPKIAFFSYLPVQLLHLRKANNSWEFALLFFSPSMFCWCLWFPKSIWELPIKYSCPELKPGNTLSWAS